MILESLLLSIYTTIYGRYRIHSTRVFDTITMWGNRKYFDFIVTQWIGSENETFI